MCPHTPVTPHDFLDGGVRVKISSSQFWKSFERYLKRVEAALKAGLTLISIASLVIKLWHSFEPWLTPHA